MGEFGGFGGFVNTRKIEDKYGDVYDVPDDLFDGVDDVMARQYVERMRAQKNSGDKLAIASLPNPPAHTPPKIAKPKNYYGEGFTGYNPLLWGEALKAAVPETGNLALGFGKMLTQPPAMTASEAAMDMTNRIAGSKTPGMDMAKMGAEQFSPVPFDPVQQAFSDDPEEAAKGIGRSLPYLAMAAWGGKGMFKRTPKIVEPGPITDPSRLIPETTQRPRTWFAGDEGITTNPLEAELGGPLREPLAPVLEGFGEAAIPEVRRTANTGVNPIAPKVPSPAQMGVHSWDRAPLGLAPSRVATDSPNRTVFEALVPERISRPPAEPGLAAVSEPSIWELPGKVVDLSNGEVPVRPPVQAEPLLPAAGPGARGQSTKAPRSEYFTKDASWDNLVKLQKQGYVEVMTDPDGTIHFKHDPAKAAEMGQATAVIEKTNAARKKPGFVDSTPVLKSARDTYRHLIGEAEETTLGRFGQAGKNLVLATQQATADAFGFSGKQTAAIRRVLAEAAPNKSQRTAILEEAIDHVERGTTSSNPNVQKVVDIYKANDALGTKLYKESGVKVKNAAGDTVPFEARENYWPHKWDDATVQKNRAQILDAIMKDNPGWSLDQAEMALFKGKKEGYGFLDALHARRTDLAGYRKDVDVIKGHYIDMARKAFNDKVLGGLKDDGSFAKAQLDQIGKEFGPEARVKAEQILERYLDKDMPTFDATLMGDAAKGMTRFEAITKLGMSTVGNMLGGTAMVGSRTRLTNMAKAFAESVTADGRNAAEEMGVLGSLFRDSAKDVGYGSDVSKIYGIAGTEKHLRTFAGLAGKHEAQTLFKEVKAGGFRAENKMKQLQDLILEPDMNKVLQQTELSPSQIDRAGSRMTDLTQGRADSMNLPRAWSHPNPMVNVLTQFKKYAFIHSRNLKDAMKRNPAMIPRLAGLMVGAGEGVAALRGIVSGRERPENIPERILDDLANAYGAGYVGDVFSAASQDSWQAAGGKLLPPAVTDTLKLGTAAYKTGASVGSEDGFDASPILEEAAGLTPIVGSRWKRELRED